MSCISSLIVSGGGRAVVLLIPGRKMRSYLCTLVCWCVHTHVSIFQEVGQPMNSRKHISPFPPSANSAGSWRGTKHLVLTVNTLRKSKFTPWADLGDPGTTGPSSQPLLPSLIQAAYTTRHKGSKSFFNTFTQYILERQFL